MIIDRIKEQLTFNCLFLVKAMRVIADGNFWYRLKVNWMRKEEDTREVHAERFMEFPFSYFF